MHACMQVGTSQLYAWGTFTHPSLRSSQPRGKPRTKTRPFGRIEDVIAKELAALETDGNANGKATGGATEEKEMDATRTAAKMEAARHRESDPYRYAVQGA